MGPLHLLPGVPILTKSFFVSLNINILVNAGNSGEEGP